MTSKTVQIEPLNELSNLLLAALASKALTEMMKRYPDMLPEEVLVMALSALLELDDEEPLGSSRQGVLDNSLDYLKDSYGNDQLLS